MHLGWREKHKRSAAFLLEASQPCVPITGCALVQLDRPVADTFRPKLPLCSSEPASSTPDAYKRTRPSGNGELATRGAALATTPASCHRVLVATIEHPAFTVDTALFRQLGELLVGRDSTALVELIKNAYDADATTVLLRGERLDEPEHAVLTVADNGTGMTDAQFRRGFLRLAARGKTEGERRSPVYKRRFTGEKGVGRLATHKLAAFLDVTTVAAVDENGLPMAAETRADQPDLPSAELAQLLRTTDHTLTMAQIDWDLIELADTLSDVHEGLVLEVGRASQTEISGTTLVLSRLRHKWTSSDLRDLVRQLNNFEPPDTLAKAIPATVLSRTLLFQQPTVRDAERQDPGIKLEVQGDFTNPEEYWTNVVRTAQWLLEIRAEPKGVSYALSPTRVGEASNEFARPLTASRSHPQPDSGPFFDARILLRSGPIPTIEGSWPDLNSGIRVYLEGFRVLPYGDLRNDWLSLDSDYTKRTGRFQIDPLLAGPDDDLRALRDLTDRDMSLRLLSNRAFFGAVFLTEAGAGGLRTLVNREGFVPDEPYQHLVELVSVGVRLLLRARALASYNLKKARRRESAEAESTASNQADSTNQEDRHQQQNGEHPSADGSPNRDTNGFDAGEDAQSSTSEEDGREWTVLGQDGSTRGSAARLQAAIADLRAILADNHDQVTTSTTAEASTPSMVELQRAVQEIDDAGALLIEDASLLRVLASIGSQLASFTHELSQLIPTAVTAEQSLEPVSGTRWPPQATPARRAIADLRRALERQAAYLVDIASTEGRRRRSRQPVRERVDAAFLAFQNTAAAQDITITNSVPGDLRTPPLFRAELQAVLSNLLTNAIKAAGAHGRIDVTAETLAGGLRLVIQNSGVAVLPEEAEGWFQPYASTTTNVDLVLGQGMGLGLPITRDLIAEYGGTVRFIRPSDSFSTSVEVLIPE